MAEIMKNNTTIPAWISTFFVFDFMLAYFNKNYCVFVNCCVTEKIITMATCLQYAKILIFCRICLV